MEKTVQMEVQLIASLQVYVTTPKSYDNLQDYQIMIILHEYGNVNTLYSLCN